MTFLAPIPSLPAVGIAGLVTGPNQRGGALAAPFDGLLQIAAGEVSPEPPPALVALPGSPPESTAAVLESPKIQPLALPMVSPLAQPLPDQAVAGLAGGAVPSTPDRPRVGRKILTDNLPLAEALPAAVAPLPPPLVLSGETITPPTDAPPRPDAAAFLPAPPPPLSRHVAGGVAPPPPAHDPAGGVQATPGATLDQATTPSNLPDAASAFTALPSDRPVMPALQRFSPLPAAGRPAEAVPRPDMNIVITLHSAVGGPAGMQRLTLKLTPSDLGSVSFDIRPTSDGARSVAVVFERSETMTLFQQDRQHLETALSLAGLPAEPGDITFALAAPNPVPAAAMDHAGATDLSFGSTDLGTGQSPRGGPAPPPPLGEAATDLSPPDPAARFRSDLRAGLDILA